jgi:hypothetical protein
VDERVALLWCGTGAYSGRLLDYVSSVRGFCWGAGLELVEDWVLRCVSDR